MLPSSLHSPSMFLSKVDERVVSKSVEFKIQYRLYLSHFKVGGVVGDYTLFHAQVSEGTDGYNVNIQL